MDIAKVTYPPFTLAQRVQKDASDAVYYAEQAAFWRQSAVENVGTSKACLKFARSCERLVVACATRLEVRLQLLADQGASA